MPVSLDLTESYREEDVCQRGKSYQSDGKMGCHKVNNIESETFSPYARSALATRSNWNLRKEEALQSNRQFGRNGSCISQMQQRQIKTCDMNPDGSAGGPDTNRDNDRNRDYNGRYDPDSSLRDYVLDKTRRFLNGNQGDVVTEIYDEIIEPIAIEICQAVDERIVQQETPP